MTPLELELIDLGDHLAIGDHAARRGTRRHVVLKLAAAILVVVALLLTVGPTRRALARWFGVGAIEIRSVQTTLPTPTSSAANKPPTTPGSVTDLARQAGVRLLQSDDPVLKVSLDRRGVVDILVIEYERFTLVEVASAGEAGPVASKLNPLGTRSDPAGVRGVAGLWISGEPHQIVFLDANGDFQTDTVRRVGNVLIWSADRTTYRIEGIEERAEALRIAESLR